MFEENEMRRHLSFGTLIAAIFFLASCNSEVTPTSELKFDSAHSIALDATIPAGKIIATTTVDTRLERQINEQLMYTIGQLNGLNGGPDMNRLQVSIGEKVELRDGTYEVSYAAKLFVSWRRDRRIPSTYTFLVPERGDYRGLQNFYERYGSDEDSGKRCLDWGAHDVTQGIFWYYYRPEKRACALAGGVRDHAVEIVADLAVSDRNTEGKYPEYSKVWEDGILVATAIFGKNEHGVTSPSDAGIAAYRQMYNDLIRTYGWPALNSLPNGEEPSATNDVVELVFNTAAGPLDVHLYLVDGIRSVDREFIEQYNARTEISDFVSYSGHSGLGANIRALANMGSFVTGQYQIFLVNGCDTFAYVDNSLKDAHQAVNPDYDGDKFFEIITNAMPSYFHSNSRSNMAVIQGLVGQFQTYREILAGFDRAQRAAVTGEADNRWPLPFIEE